MSNDKYLLLGASRGLGKSFSKLLRSAEVFHISVARNSTEVKNFIPLDLAILENVSAVVDIIKDQGITHIIYFAGGGPYGEFEKKEFKDHMWAFN